MTKLTALETLLEKVEAGTASKLDTHLESILLSITEGDIEQAGFIFSKIHFIHHGSLNAAKALFEAVLPDIKQFSIITDPTCIKATVAAWPEGLSGAKEITGEGWHEDDPSRAWLIAILKALIAIEKEQADG